MNSKLLKQLFIQLANYSDRFKYTFNKSMKQLLVILIGCCPMMPLIADDTDIFLGSGNFQEGVLPNVLFILDNSGSMNSTARDGNGQSTGQTRLEAMKDAFSEIMSRISGVNVGLMRFNAPGGSVMYPITNVDTPIASQALQTNPDMRESGDDAFETTVDGEMDIDDVSIPLGLRPAANTTTTVTGWIRHQEDDREERISDGREMDGAWMNMNSNQISAIRYYDLGIPRGATIVSAKIIMVAAASMYGDWQTEVRGQYVDNPTRFSGNHYDLFNRWNGSVTTNSLNWALPSSEPWLYGNTYESPDITPIIQEIIDHPDWDENDAIVLMMNNSTGDRSGILYRNSSNATQGENGTNTKLEITYTTSIAESANLVGLRFQDIDIPQGATITNAYLSFKASESRNIVDNLQLDISIEPSNNTAPFVRSAFGLTGKSKSLTTVPWSPETDWVQDVAYATSDISTLIQQVVNRPGWCGNNAMTFYIEPNASSTSGSRTFYTFDDELERHPELVVNYTGGANGCQNKVWNTRIDSAEDDAEESSNGGVTNSGTYFDFRNNQTNGLRFESVPLKKNATILEAYLEFDAIAGSNNSHTIDIWGEDVASPLAYPNSNRNISNRTKTTATVNWPISNWVVNSIYRTPDLKDMVQEIVSRGDWSPGNAMAFIMKANGPSSGPAAYTFNSSPARAPKLVIKVQDGGIENSVFTVRTHLDNLVQNLYGHTWTPIVDTLYESALYYRGNQVYYGADRELFNPIQGNTDERYKRVSIPESYTGGTHVIPSGCDPVNFPDDPDCRAEYISNTPSVPMYNSPIVSDCQKSHVVLLTDGEANNNHSQSLISSLTGVANCSSDSGRSSERCGRTLANWMANNDMKPALTATDNTISTHTIAFNLSNSNAVRFLEDLAAEGNGSFKSANTAAELADAFDAILREIVSVNTTFTTPGVTVNNFNRLTNRSDIYFSVFKPRGTPLWAGNLKRYRLLGEDSVISDVNGSAAVDSNTGFFKDTAKSYWSPITDGADVTLGGAASQLPITRNVYTFFDSPTDGTRSLNLIDPVNTLEVANNNITIAMMNAADQTDRDNMVSWIMGQDTKDADNDGNTTEPRYSIGDPLHSIPALVTYGGSEANPDTIIYFGTNEGYLHAINGATGQEYFAFMPQTLLNNVNTLYDNDVNNDHPYGFDGSPVIWIQDNNNNGEIGSGDKVYLYMGMRRGGNDLYALDVTDRAAPKMLWTIDGGVGDFTSLGQTWSKPVKTRVQISGAIRDVLIFGGGFDPNIDNYRNNRLEVAVGNAIYMVDAETGQLLWQAGKSLSAGLGLSDSDMKYAMPADISVVDVDQDNLADILFIGDTGGQIWRFDIHHGNTAPDLVTGGVIAELGADSGANQRRFHNRIDVSFVGLNGNVKLALSVGSGTINEPLEQLVENRFYVIFQDDVFGAPVTYTKLTHTNLTDRTSDITDVPITNNGWYIDLSDLGEKVLSASLTVNNIIIFTTYAPSSSVSACSGVVGSGRVYLASLFNGIPPKDLDGDEIIEITDRSRQLKTPSIPPTPRMLFPEESSKPTVLIGPEQPLQDVDFGVDGEMNAIYFQELKD